MKTYNGRTQADEAKRQGRQAALSRLAELDAIVPRSVEDLYDATGSTPHTKVADAIAEKKDLRKNL
jgi:hypothetical protein